MLFPFSAVRPVQSELMSDVRSAVENSRHLLAHAPSGLGKTAASLSPALEYALDNGKAVLFLTPRHSQHQIALETLRKIKDKHNINFRVADIIGKKWLCSVDGLDSLMNSEFNEFCKTLRQEERCTFYKNTRTKEHTLTKGAAAALSELENKFHHAEEAKELLSETYCTYEILSSLAKKSTVIIADYYHMFSTVKSSFLARIGRDMKDLIVIVDEAHNLAGRIRDIASMKISSFTLEKAGKEAEAFGFYDVRDNIESMGNILNEIASEKVRDGNASFVEKSLLIEKAEGRLGKIEPVLEKLVAASDEIKLQQKKSYISSLSRFFDLWLESGAGYAKIISVGRTKGGKSYVSLANKCLDPSVHSSVLKDVRSAILMSGTFLPLDMHLNVLGLEKERCSLKTYTSPFPRENKLAIVVKDTTTKYSKRTEENYRKMAGYVARCCNAIPGNCAVFFPSYAIRDIIFSLSKGSIGKKVMLERQDSNKAERRQLYDNFIQSYVDGAALFGVISGSFDEGMDMPDKYLNGVIIVGIPLEKPDLETTALIDYYDYRFKRGWDYGYIYPAMIRCLQAGGRAIRSESDRGVMVFIDERFIWSNYRKVFPSDMGLRITTEPEKLISEFWR